MTVPSIQCLSTCQGPPWSLTSAAPRSSSSPGTWLSIKSICSRSPSPARPGHISERAGGGSRPTLTPHFLGQLPCSPEPSSLGCLGPRGSRASSEIRKDSSEKSSVDFKAERQRWDTGSLQSWGPYRFRLHSRHWGQVGGQPLGHSRGRSPSHDLFLRYQHIRYRSPVPSSPPNDIPTCPYQGSTHLIS